MAGSAATLTTACAISPNFSTRYEMRCCARRRYEKTTRCSTLAQETGSSHSALTTSSVLIYVKDKAAALAEFYRVLKPGGRISLFEPIYSWMSSCDPDSFSGYDIEPAARADRMIMQTGL